MQIVQKKIEELIPYINNSRTHSDEQVAQIAASIKEFGWTNPILVDGENGIIAGHGRLLAARKLGLSLIPVIELNTMTPAQKKAYVIADNQLALNSGWNTDLLKLEIEELKNVNFDLDLLGFDENFLNSLLEPEVVEGLTDEDAVPEVPDEPKTKLRDIYELGNHRLMCGDSTSIDSVEKLMDGQKADMVFTDPPYGVSYADKNKSLNVLSKGNHIQTEIINDHLKGEDLKEFFYQIFTSLFVAMKNGCPFYVCAPQGGEQMMMMMMMDNAGMPMRHELIWIKNNHVLGRADYHYKHEPILYGWKEGASHAWYGERNKFSVWEVNKPTSSKLHPTMKPIELIEIALENSSKYKGLILDLFGGSGSTLIACEKLGRKAYLMELDPKYCDVIVKRWEDFTGKKAKLLNNNENVV